METTERTPPGTAQQIEDQSQQGTAILYNLACQSYFLQFKITHYSLCGVKILIYKIICLLLKINNIFFI